MSFRERIRHVIFRHDTRGSQAFDVILLLLIALSVLVVMLESIDSIDKVFHTELYYIEWAFTILFTIEYGLRIYSLAPHHWRYVKSFYGIIDLISILPTYLSIFIPASQALISVRGLRLLRIFRIFKLSNYFGEMDQLLAALRASRAKISVFLTAVLLIAVVVGTLMYLIEGDAGGFVNIPISIYWTIVTMTTVGYGDIAPVTPLGQIIASFLMIIGYGILAVPTGIVSSEMISSTRRALSVVCDQCGEDSHLKRAEFCHKCGAALPEF